MAEPPPSFPEPRFLRRLGAALVSILAVALFVFLFVVAGRLLILAFAGILLAVLLDGMAQWLAGRTPLERGSALLVGIVGLLAATVGFWWFVGPQVVAQAVLLEQALPEGLSAAEAWLRQYPWGRTLLNEAQDPLEMLSNGDGMMSQITGAFTTVTDIVINLIVVVFVALYGAANPALYVDNALRLLPKPNRSRGREVLAALARALRSWFFGQAVAMVAVGVLTTVGLILLDVPMAIALGVIAGLLEFVPYLGPILASIPIILIALLEGPEVALYVVLFLVVLQQFESYVITPMAQQYAVSMPPALLIVGQVLFGILFGFVGVVFATPVLVAVIVLVQMLYVEDVLDDEAVILGSEKAAASGRERSRFYSLRRRFYARRLPTPHEEG
jgi:predicted PurR-regulated permease PerM